MKIQQVTNLGLAASAVAAFAFQTIASAAPTPFSQQWGLKNTGQNICSLSGSCQSGTPGVDIKAISAWNVSSDCSRAIVAVLDSGADLTHPDLKDSVIGGKNFTVNPPTDDPTDDNLHGTHVTGTIAGSGDAMSGAAGICKTARVLAVKVGDAQGRLTDSDIIEGVEYASRSGAKVVNASFGGGGRSEVMAATIKKASKTLFIIAAGNGSYWTGKGYDIDKSPVYPASYALPNIIAVAATDNRDNLGGFSNFGAKTVHLAAPGVGIMSTAPVVATAEMRDAKIPAKYAFLDGTSMATPHVTGAVALLMSSQPTLTPAQVKQKLISSADRIPSLAGKVASGGRLNLQKLLAKTRRR